MTLENNTKEKKVFYCEICDNVSPKLTQYLTHERSSSHIQACLKYRQEITSDKKQLEAMSKIMSEKMGIQTKNTNELVLQIVALMSKQRLTNEQVKAARERKKEKLQQKN